MSLINDALKRAAEKPAAIPSSSELAAGLHPADGPQAGLPVLSLLILLIPMIALGVWFLAKGLQLNAPPKAVPAEAVAARAPEPALIVAPTNLPSVIPRPPAQQPAFKLQAIYWRSLRPAAVINGKMVIVGDHVEKARITGIDQQSVTLMVDGENEALQLR